MNSKPLIIGHRGAKGYVCENTIASIKKAFELGADGVEIDVHICKTGEIIVFHDLDLKRFFEDKRKLSEVSFSEIRTFKLNGKYQIPTLVEVLQIIPKGKWLNIELKGRNTAKPVFKCLENNSAIHQDQIIISSFYKRELAAYRLLDTEAKLGVLTNFDFDKALIFSKKIDAYSFHPHFSLVNEETLKAIKNSGFNVFVWTVNDSEDIEHFKSFGVDGVITDFPDRMVVD